MQSALFDPPEDPPRPAPAQRLKVLPCPPDPALQALAAALPRRIYVCTSSWTYPGWAGLVWDQAYAEPLLSKHGLAAYSQHPLMRTVSLDRTFYRPLSASQYAAYAAQVPDDFRFVVKAPSIVTDAMVRAEAGRALQPNPQFLNPELALQEFVQPALEGLQHKIGALVFQLSPLTPLLLGQLPQVLERLRLMLSALPALHPVAPDGVIAVEVRDPEFIGPDLVDVLRASGAVYCLGLHAKMPSIQDQLPMLRKLWPAPMVCRWNLNPIHGAFGYEDARVLYSPYDTTVDEDLDTRQALVRVALATARAGLPAYITISNKAEGCAPLSVAALVRELVGREEG